MINFLNITYLKTGNQKQKKAYNILKENFVLEKLSNYNPILTGTIPINIDTETSDLDIICYFKDKEEFRNQLRILFQNHKHFIITENVNINSVKANFIIDDIELEVFGQNVPTQEQNAYRHMLIEHKILLENDEIFRQQIIELKRKGYKTEPAFGKLLGIAGNPYTELLNFEL